MCSILSWQAVMAGAFTCGFPPAIRGQPSEETDKTMMPSWLHGLDLQLYKPIQEQLAFSHHLVARGPRQHLSFATPDLRQIWPISPSHTYSLHTIPYAAKTTGSQNGFTCCQSGELLHYHAATTILRSHQRSAGNRSLHSWYRSEVAQRYRAVPRQHHLRRHGSNSLAQALHQGIEDYAPEGSYLPPPSHQGAPRRHEPDSSDSLPAVRGLVRQQGSHQKALQFPKVCPNHIHSR